MEFTLGISSSKAIFKEVETVKAPDPIYFVHDYDTSVVEDFDPHDHTAVPINGSIVVETCPRWDSIETQATSYQEI